MPTTIRWMLGFAVSILVGWWLTGVFVRVLRDRLDFIRQRPGIWHRPGQVPSWLTGIVERTFFTVAVAFNVPGAVVAMVAWIAAKLATDWNRLTGDDADHAGAHTGLLGGLVSMFFALIGGLICRGTTGTLP